jgi:hypothetical protein
VQVLQQVQRVLGSIQEHSSWLVDELERHERKQVLQVLGNILDEGHNHMHTGMRMEHRVQCLQQVLVEHRQLPCRLVQQQR